MRAIASARVAGIRNCPRTALVTVPVDLDHPVTAQDLLEPQPAHVGALDLDGGPLGYDLFKTKKDGCVRAVFDPSRPS